MPAAPKPKPDPKATHLQAYESKIAKWKASGEVTVDMRSMTPSEVHAFRKDVELLTGKQTVPTLILVDMLAAIYESRVLSTKELAETCSTTRQSVMKRLRAFRQHNFVRKAGQGYWLATPRLDEFMQRRFGYVFGQFDSEEARDLQTSMLKRAAEREARRSKKAISNPLPTSVRRR